MEDNVKEILYKQLELLSKRSQKISVDELPVISHAMVEVATLIYAMQNRLENLFN